MNKKIKIIILLIILVLAILVINLFIKESQKEFCINSELILEFDEDRGYNISKCPEGCKLSSCYGIQTSCCPKGILN